MISRLKLSLALALAMGLALPRIGEARVVEVAFVLDAPTTSLQKKLFIDRATLQAQAAMLDLHFADASFALSQINAPHRDRLEGALRTSFYKSVTVSGLKAKKRKKVGDEWHFAFSGIIPDTPPDISDAALMAELHHLIESRSAILTPEFAMELALAYPELALFDSALLFWRHVFSGHSHAMLVTEAKLSAADFELSARRIKADVIPSDLRGIFQLLDQAPFNPTLCLSLLPMLDEQQLPALASVMGHACLTLERTSPNYQKLLASVPQAQADRKPSQDQIESVAVEAEMLAEAQIFEDSFWLTHLVINSLGTLPAEFEPGVVEGGDAGSGSADGLVLEVIDLGGDEGDSLALEPLDAIDLPERFRAFEQNPTQAAMDSLATALIEAGYPATAKSFETQAAK